MAVSPPSKVVRLDRAALDALGLDGQAVSLFGNGDRVAFQRAPALRALAADQITRDVDVWRIAHMRLAD